MRPRRVDSNHAIIRGIFINAGFGVADTSQCGNGIPDLFVSNEGITCAIEIKDGSKSPSQRKLTDREKNFRRSWKGQYYIVENEFQATHIVKWMTVEYRKPD